MKTTLVALCTAALLSGAALANDPQSTNDRDSAARDGSGNDAFASLDTDSDGKLSKDEAAASDNLKSSFTMIDRNSDGYISRGELRRNTMPKPKRD